MSCTDCNSKNPLQRDGKSQSQRFLEELSPDYVKVDERSLSDLLFFARNFAQQVNYFNTFNVSDGNWKDFIENDVSARIAIIAVTDTDNPFDTFRDFLEVLNEFQENSGHTAAQLRAKLSPMLELTVDQFQLIASWYRRMGEHEDFKKEIGHLIKGKLRRALKKLIAADSSAIALGLSDGTLESRYTGFATEWIEDSTATTWAAYLAEPWTTPDPDLFGTDSLDQKATNYATRLESNFSAAWEAEVRTVSLADTFLKETLSEWPSHQPHYALFLAFLLLFKHSQDHINTLTKSHLEFHYRDVLGMEEQAPVPDSVHLIFGLAKNVLTHKLDAGTELTAGKDSEKVDQVYTLDEELIINTALAVEFKSVFVDDESNSQVFASPTANSGDGNGGDFENEDEPSWKAFGTNNEEETKRAEVGFALASPALFLSEGARTITLSFGFTDASWAALWAARPATVAEEVKEDFALYLTTKKEWMQVNQETIDVSYSQGTATLKVEFTIPSDADPIVAYSAKAHGAGFDTAFPMVKLILNPEQELYPYHFLKLGKLCQVTIAVAVTGCKNLVIQNENSPLSPSKKFQPFGSKPSIGSPFYVGSTEVFSKNLTSLKLSFEWLGLPVSGASEPTGFSDYYAEYAVVAPGSAIPDDDTFTAPISILTSDGWKDLLYDSTGKNGAVTRKTITPTLFYNNEFDGTTDASKPNPWGKNYISIPRSAWTLNQSLLGLGAATEALSFKEYSTDLKQGFIRLSLDGSTFLHGLYGKAITYAALNTPTTMPNEPYTPEVGSISLDYSAEATIDLRYDSITRPAFKDRIEKFYHVAPFGTEEVHPEIYIPRFKANGNPEKASYLVPQFMGKGNFFLGISSMNLSESRNLSMLFQVAEATADPEVLNPDIDWYCRIGLKDIEGTHTASAADDKPTKYGWKKLDATEVYSDTTNGLLNSGIINFSLPDDATTDHTLLTTGLHWLMGAINEETVIEDGLTVGVKSVRGISEVLSVQAQAALATFDDRDNAAEHYDAPLAAEKIAKMLPKQAEVKTISQPYASFGGKAKESGDTFYARVSERLRHKDRAATIWDYEALVLEHFPSVYRVKCINHTSLCSQLAPGWVYLVVVSNQVNQNAVNPLEPRISLATLTEIKDYLLARTSPFVNLIVDNPTFEPVKVDFKVAFVTGKDPGYYLTQLNTDLVRYLSPWAFTSGTDITFSSSIHKSAIINFVEELEYVDYVTCFYMYHYNERDENGNPIPNTIDIDEAEISTPSAILVSVAQHQISEVPDDNRICDPPLAETEDEDESEDCNHSAPNAEDTL